MDYRIDKPVADVWPEHAKLVERNEPVDLTFVFLYPGGRETRYEPYVVTPASQMQILGKVLNHMRISRPVAIFSYGERWISLAGINGQPMDDPARKEGVMYQFDTDLGCESRSAMIETVGGRRRLSKPVETTGVGDSFFGHLFMQALQHSFYDSSFNTELHVEKT
jgi:hypothetical protein